MKKVLGLLLVLVLGFVSSTNYYVSNSGNDSWDGKSDATAWKTIEKVNSFNFSVGDDVYFKCGSKWARKQLIVDWGGNVNNPVVIGAYYGNGSKGILGNKPIFQGALHTVENGEITTPGYPSSVWGSLLLIRKEYVTIANISFENSGGYFLEAEGNKYNTSHLKLINLDGNLSTTAGFVFMNVNDVEVMGCDVTGNGYGKVVQGLDIAWGAAIALVNTNNTYIHHNNVHENWGECINHNSGSRNGIVE